MATIQHGSVVYAPVWSSDGMRKELHPVVILTPTNAIAGARELKGVCVSTKPELCPASCQVTMPFANPGAKSRTGLTRPCTAHCNRFVTIHKAEIVGLIGHTPAKQLGDILALVGELEQPRSPSPECAE